MDDAIDDTPGTPDVAPEQTAAPALEETGAGDVATDTPPDRLSIDPRSAYFDGDTLRRGIGIRFKGTARTNVEEYSISQGWIRVQAGRAMDRKGRPLTIKLNGEVEAWYEDLGDDPPVARAS